MDNRYNLNRVAYFVAVVEEGSITAAARRLGVSKAVVSKQLRSLEEELGVDLMFRNTRRMTPTDAGRELHRRAHGPLRRTHEALDAIRERGETPRGRLRIAAPVDYGLLHVAPLVARYRSAHPHVEVELALRDERLDPVEHRYDVTFRVGWLAESSQLARKIAPFTELAIAHPSLSAEAPEQLCDLPFVENTVLPSPNRWTFTRGAASREVELRTALQTNLTAAVRHAVLGSPCFAVLPDFLVADDLAAGRLVRLCPDWSLRTGAIYTVRAPSPTPPLALRVFLDLVHGAP